MPRMQPPSRKPSQRRFFTWVTLFGLFLDLIPHTACAAETPILISLGGITGAECGIPFQKDGFTLTLTNSSLGSGAEGRCSFNLGSSRLDLYPGNLRIDLASLPGPLLQVEASAIDACGRGCTRLILAQGSQVMSVTTNAQFGATELKALVPAGTLVDTLYLATFEGAFSQVRLVVDSPTQRPALSFRRDGNQIWLTWPNSFPGCVVQQSDSLSPPMAWTPLPDVPVAGTGTFELRLSPTARTAHFRLACP